MEKLNLDKNNLKKFGITMGVAFFLITLILSLRHKQVILPIAITSLAFFILALSLPVLLKPVYIFWMKLAFILGWFNTRLILYVLFYLIFTPIGLLMRLFGRNPLDRRIEKHKDSYWRRKDKREFQPLNYERQF